MKITFLASYNIDGQKNQQRMEYDTKDIEKTLERRLKTAFPNASGITIVLDDQPAAAPLTKVTK